MFKTRVTLSSIKVSHFIAFPKKGFLVLIVSVNPCAYFPRAFQQVSLQCKFAFTFFRLTSYLSRKTNQIPYVRLRLTKERKENQIVERKKKRAPSNPTDFHQSAAEL